MMSGSAERTINLAWNDRNNPHWLNSNQPLPRDECAYRDTDGFLVQGIFRYVGLNKENSISYPLEDVKAADGGK